MRAAKKEGSLRKPKFTFSWLILKRCDTTANFSEEKISKKEKEKEKKTRKKEDGKEESKKSKAHLIHSCPDSRSPAPSGNY